MIVRIEKKPNALTDLALTQQNGQTHSNNLFYLSVLDHLVGLALKGLNTSILQV